MGVWVAVFLSERYNSTTDNGRRNGGFFFYQKGITVPWTEGSLDGGLFYQKGTTVPRTMGV